MALRKSSQSKGRGRPSKRAHDDYDTPTKGSQTLTTARKRAADPTLPTKSILRRKVWSHGQEVLLAEAVPWAISCNPRNLWTRIRKDPRFVAVLGQYNGNEMRLAHNRLTDLHRALNMRLFGRYIVPRPVPHLELMDGNSNVYLPDMEVPQTTTVVSRDPTTNLPTNIRTRVTFTPMAKSTPAWHKHRTHLDNQPLAASAAVMMPPYGPEFGSYDSDDEYDTEGLTRRLYFATEMALREKMDGVSQAAALAPAAADYVAELSKVRENVTRVAGPRVASYEVDQAMRAITAQREPQPAAGYLLPSYEAVQPVWSERECIFYDARMYYQHRESLVALGEGMHAADELERIFGGAILVDGVYPLKSLKTYLQCRLAMPLWMALRVCRLMLSIRSGEHRRQVLNRVILDHFEQNEFARTFFDLSLRGGGKHYLLSPFWAQKQENVDVARQINHY